MAVIVSCPRHYAYKGRRYPTRECDCCKRIYYLVQAVITWPRYWLEYRTKRGA